MSRLLRLMLGTSLLLGSMSGCGPTTMTPPTTKVTLEVNQAIGVQYQNAAKFVAGKDTAILAYLEAPVVPNAQTQTIAVARDNQAVVTLTPMASATPVNPLVFVCPSREQCGNWAAGSYTFTASIDGNQQTATATFVTRRPLRVLAVPVTVNYGALGGVLTPDDKWKTGGEFMRRTFPVAADGFRWTPREALDLSMIDISTDNGQREVWQRLANLNPPTCTSNPAQAGCYDKIIGFVKSRIGALQGYTFGDPANIVVNDDEDMMGTVAHESGHPYQLGDEYVGGQFNCSVNPTPASYMGADFQRQVMGMGYACTSSTEAASTVGGTGVAIIANTSHPFEVGGRGVLGDAVNFMGSGAPQAQQWISPRAYDNLFEVLAPTVGPMAVGRVLEIEGAWTRDTAGTTTVELDPWYSYEGTVPADTQPATGDTLYLRALDANDAVLATQTLEDGFFPIQDPPAATRIDGDVFHTAIAFPDTVTKLQILRGTTVLTELPVSANPPVITLTAPMGGGTLSGQNEIAWTIADSDGAGTFSSNVEYSADNGTTWLQLTTNIEGDMVSLTANFDDLPGSDGKSLVRITATDGLNTATAVSAAFSVAVKAPEVAILSPEASDAIKVGETVWLEVDAYDEQDGDLESASAIKWTSDRDGELGGGALLAVSSLTAGSHTLTVTVTNSLGQSTAKNVAITVAP